ncbi:CNH domain-containing protein [Lineolata rhizophorae]|uniref:CNH domain-containing protein n=1 Tax=Lineolata rhizophorae TaxID=578093 RepID=A0A6A6NQ51_9PEZI|nr:CNH domain-containing protein [Lineolata rhizophorae]
MSYNQNGQYYNSAAGYHQQQHHATSGYHHQQGGGYGLRRTSSFDNGDDAGFGAAADERRGSDRSNTIAGRQNDELFMGSMSPHGSGNVSSSGYSSDLHHHGSQSSQHQPQGPASPQTIGVSRTQSAASHAPYNPAAYVDASQRNAAGAGGAGAGYGAHPYSFSTGTYQSYGSPPAPQYQTPPLAQQPFAGGRSHHQSLPSPAALSARSSRHGSSNHVDRPLPSPGYPSDPSLPPTPGPPPPPHVQYSPQRVQSERHPQGRPLPGRPQNSDDALNYVNGPNGSPRIEVENSTSTLRGGHEQASQLPYPTEETGPNGFPTVPYEEYSTSDESDPEAAAGALAFEEAERQEQEDRARRESGQSALFSSYTSERPAEPASAGGGSDSDYAAHGFDIGAFGGGFEPHHLSYGANLVPAQTSMNGADSHSQPVSSSGSVQQRSRDASEASHRDPIHPFPPFQTGATTDVYGTGGLSEPTTHPRRLSFEDDDESGYTGGPEEIFFHPGPTNRPLPPPPPSSDGRPSPASPAWPQTYGRHYPSAPDAYSPSVTSTSATYVPRSQSLLSTGTGPPAAIPSRSKTDAEQYRIQQQQQQLRRSAMLNNGSTEALSPPSETVPIDLPAIPNKRFNPQKLTTADFRKCAEPWALSSIIAWMKFMTDGEAYLKEQAILDGLVALFTNKVPTMNVADAETLSAGVVEEMYKAGTLKREEEWLKFTNATMNGVLFQLTGTGCYAPMLHNFKTPGRCYSFHCQRTLKKIDLHAQPSVRQVEDWQTYYKIKKEDVEGVNKKEVERQNILHEIVQTEDNFMESCTVLQVLYRNSLLAAKPPVIAPKHVDGFIRDVFGRIDPVKKANEDFLLPQLKYRQQEQGPWIVGFSDIFREWIRKAKSAYIDYAAAFPRASFIVRLEAEKNMLFRSFLDNARNHKMSNKLSWDTYLKAPITRLQHYGLLLQTVLKRSVLDSEEKRNLAVAIEEIKVVTLECDTKVAEMQRKVDLQDLQTKLILRPGMQRVELNLDHLGRELIFKGDLQRAGGSRFNWVDIHALLFDHYLVMAKTITQKDAEGGTKHERYDVSRLPIPMDLLVLESANDEPVMKSSVKGIATARPSASNVPTARSSTSVGGGPGPLVHTNTSSSVNSMTTTSSGKSSLVASTVLEGPKDDKILYPFRIKHLGKETYTLYAPSAANRLEWSEKILEAKTKHAAALFAQNAEPFRLRVIADSAFAYDSGTAATNTRSVVIKGTPLDRAIDEVERLFQNSGRPGPICRAKVNCATAFMQPYGKHMVAVGTDYGVYLSEIDNPRGWSRAIPIQRVTQIAVLEEFSLMILISDKALIAYHLDVVCPVGGVPPGNDSARKAPQKLSGNRDVGFFATGKMKDRTLVFYKKREGISSTFKVLEPVFQKSTEKKSRLFRSGRTEFFREYDEFYIPTECFGMNLFHSSLAVSTSKGFEVLNLDKKHSWSVPDLKAPHVATIASRLAGQDPLGMFRLSDQEFLLCYEQCGVYVNKHGEVSRSVIMEFVGRARSAAVYGPYVLLFDPDFVEIRNAQNGRLRQVIAGRDVKCLDDALTGGTAGQRSIKISLQHPGLEKVQIVVELLLNEGQEE